MIWTPDISGRYYYSSGDSLDGGIIQVTDHISERIKTFQIEVEDMTTFIYILVIDLHKIIQILFHMID